MSDGLKKLSIEDLKNGYNLIKNAKDFIDKYSPSTGTHGAMQAILEELGLRSVKE